MGNSFCCNNFDRKQQMVIQSDLIYETFEEKVNHPVKVKDAKNDIILNRNHKHDYSFQKTNTCTPQSIDESDFINPLPDIVIIKKKH